MSGEPRFSIVIPNYNSGEVLQRAICSILEQRYSNLQLIMADGGSTDVSRQIIEQYRDSFDVVISAKDDGQADGLNKGFRHADGDIYGWLCADDELLPGSLRHVAKQFAEHPDVDVLTGCCERIFDDGSKYVTPADTDAWDNIIIQNTIEQPSTFWKAKLHRQVGELDNSYYLSFDWVLWIWFRNAGARLSTTDRVLSRYYFTDNSKCNNAGNLFAEEAYRVLSEYGPLKGHLAEIFRHLYYKYDLKGCVDKPRTSSLLRYLCFLATLACLRITIGKRLLRMYNWHFASLQERRLKWYDSRQY